MQTPAIVLHAGRMQIIPGRSVDTCGQLGTGQQLPERPSARRSCAA